MGHRAYKYRLYPTAEQKVLFAKTFGCCRKIYNLMLSDMIRCYEETGSFGSFTPAMYKNEYPYLREVDSLALANKQLDLKTAFRARFDEKRKGHAGFPRFKSAKHSRRSYTTNNQNGTVCVGDGYVRLPKAGRVKAVIHRNAPDGHILKSATVSMERDGTYYCSVLYEYDGTVPAVLRPEQNAVGLDYKSDGLYVSSDGEVCGSPKFFRKAQKHLARAQKRLSRKKGSRKGEAESSNHKRQKHLVAKIHRHVANQRRDFLHKESSAITKRYDLVCVEGLDMRVMSNKGFGNGKATLDNGYGMFLDMLEYKLRDKGKALIRVDKWFPSSQICSACGCRDPVTKDLSVRVWTCPECGTVHDRDVNAAKNILREGVRIHKAMAA